MSTHLPTDWDTGGSGMVDSKGMAAATRDGRAHAETRDISRRNFLAGAAGVGVLGASALGGLGLTGCSTAKPAAETTSGTASSAAADASGATNTIKPANAPTGYLIDWLGSAPSVNNAEITSTIDTDLLIVGAGNGGMAAAAYAANLGVDFKLCEVSDAPGRTRFWFASVDAKPFTDKGLYVDRARLIGEMARYTSGTCDQRLLNMFMNESAGVYEFVNSLMEPTGADIVLGSTAMPGGMGGTPYYTPPWEIHYEVEGDYSKAVARNDAFLDLITKKGNEVLYRHELVKLVGGNGSAVTGAIFKTENGYVQINGKKGVLLTTGGYSANSDMLTALSPLTVQCTTALGYNPNNKGQGIKAALWVGAVKDVTSATMIFDRGLVPPGTKAGYVEGTAESGEGQFPGTVAVGGIGQFNPGTQPFLKVTVKGERFINESGDYDFPTHAAAQLPSGTYFSIWDGNFKDDVYRFGTLGCSELTKALMPALLAPGGIFDDLVKAGTLLRADTIEDLAAQMFGGDKASEATFIATVARYNELYDKQLDSDFGKEAYRLSSLRTAPFYAAHLGGTLLTTIDGIRINADCQALDANYEPIEGLYAAGDCSGSMFSGNYPDQLHGFAVGRTMTEALHVVKLVASK